MDTTSAEFPTNQQHPPKQFAIIARKYHSLVQGEYADMSIQTPAWVKDAVFYQIFPDRFAKSDRVHKPSNLAAWDAEPTFHNFMGGDLQGVIDKLDYLVDLGINAIYFNPIFMSASNHRYHTADYFRIDPLLGTMDDFCEMLEQAHARGIRVILDGVFNHASRGFFQFNHLMECGAESPYTDWFHIHEYPIRAFGDDVRPNYDAWWGLPALPKFNTNTPAVREYLWSVGEFWLKLGIDGWRLDVPNEIDDDEFWREFRRRCRAINPECYIVGELWHDAERWLQGDQFDAVMNYVFTRAAFGYFIGDRMDQTDTHRTGYGHMGTLNGHQFLTELDRFINHLYDQEIVQVQLNMLGSHDTPRTMTVAGNDASGVSLMFLAQMTMPGAPNIYYGDEIGMQGGHDPYCRYTFPWDKEANWNSDLRKDLQRYIQMRHDIPALRYGSYRSIHADHNVVVYVRQHEGQTALVAFNNAFEERTVHFQWPEGAANTLQSVLESGEISAEAPLILPARSGRVFVG